MTVQVPADHVVTCAQFENFVKERHHLEEQKNKAERDAWEMPEGGFLYT